MNRIVWEVHDSEEEAEKEVIDIEEDITDDISFMSISECTQSDESETTCSSFTLGSQTTLEPDYSDYTEDDYSDDTIYYTENAWWNKDGLNVYR